jgi:lipopolysaccharide export system permease protein
VNVVRQLILKEWFKFFSASVFVLFLLLSAANLISGFLRRNVTPLEVILNHLIETPTHMKLIFPVSCLVASLFAINKLKQRNELTAIFSGGYSRKKFIFCIFTAALSVGVFQFVISAFLEPYTKSRRHDIIQDSEAKFRNLKSKGLRSSTIGSGKIWYKSNNYFFSFSKYDRIEEKLIDLSIFYYNNTNQLSKVLYSEYASFNRDRNKWIIPKADIIDSLDTKSFAEEKQLVDVELDIKERPNEFNQIEADITTLSVLKLSNYINKLAKKGINVNEYMVLLLDKFSTAIICVLFGLVATISSFNSNKRNSSMGKTIFAIFIFIIVYWLVNSYFLELGKNSKLNPYVACFAVPLAFFIFLATFFYHHRKLR